MRRVLAALSLAACGRVGFATDADSPPDATECTGGDLAIVDGASGDCYTRFDTPITWSAAAAACAALGPTTFLASIHSEAENTQMFAFVGTRTWFGATDVGQENTFTYQSGEPFDFTKWTNTEPNVGIEGCAQFIDDNEGQWNEAPCGTTEPALCVRRAP